MSLILLVEDNEMNRDMLSRRLKRKGFELVPRKTVLLLSKMQSNICQH